jgi:hypothetical protein
LPLEVIAVDDGSRDGTRKIVWQAREAGHVDTMIHHGTCCGGSAARSPWSDHGSATIPMAISAIDPRLARLRDGALGNAARCH